MQLLLLIAMILVGDPVVDKAGGSELEVSPVVLNLAPGETSATIEVRNRGDGPVTIQARPYDWSQTADDDVLTPTAEVILSPPIFTVPARGSQTLRLMLRGDAVTAADRDRSYRLLLDEVPSAQRDAEQVQMTLRLSLPVFAASGPSAPALAWTSSRAPGGVLILTATNRGSSHVRVSEVQATLADGSAGRVTAQGRSPYVLAGAGKRWILEAPDAGPGATVRLRVVTQVGASDVTLSL